MKISLADALKRFSQRCPWDHARRLMLSYIWTGELIVYATEGRVLEYDLYPADDLHPPRQIFEWDKIQEVWSASSFIDLESEIDWRAGTIDIPVRSTIGSGAPRVWWGDNVTIHLAGICFDETVVDACAMASPVAESSSSISATVGRRRKWEWEDALVSLIARENTPDGLEFKQQQDVEDMLREFFDPKGTGQTPVESEIRQRASLVVRALGRK